MEMSNTLFETNEKLVLEKIYRWSLKTIDGTRSDIDFPVDENVWDSVCSERGICTHKTCGGEDTKCFIREQKELADSDVIIVNHHLFTLFDGVSDDKEGYLYKNDFVILMKRIQLSRLRLITLPGVSREMIKYHLLKLYNQQKKKGFLLTLPSLHIQAIIQNLLELNKEFLQAQKRLFHKD